MHSLRRRHAQPLPAPRTRGDLTMVATDSHEAWLAWAERNEIDTVGSFENEYGERYVIYRNKNGDTPYVSGDELDWAKRVPLLWNAKNFMFNAAERDQVARILWPTVEDILASYQ